MATIAVECGHVSGLFGAAILTTAGPDVVREAGPDQILGLDTRDPTEGSPASTTDRSPSCHQHLRNRDALRRVPLALALESCAAGRGDYPIAKPLFGGRARLRSTLGGTMGGIVDAAVDHDGPSDARGLVGDRNRRLLFRHAGEQLRDRGTLVRADLRLAHDRHRAGDEK